MVIATHFFWALYRAFTAVPELAEGSLFVLCPVCRMRGLRKSRDDLVFTKVVSLKKESLKVLIYISGVSSTIGRRPLEKDEARRFAKREE